MDEYISREAMLNLIAHNDKVCHYADERYENVVYATTQTICKVVAEMPAADVQPGKDVIKVLQQVSDTCERTRMCMECEFYSKNSGMCVFADMPIFWKHEEIEKALRDGDAE